MLAAAFVTPPAGAANPLSTEVTLLLAEGHHPRSFSPPQEPVTSLRGALDAGLIELVAETTVTVVPGQNRIFTLRLEDDSSTTGSLQFELQNLKGELTLELPAGIPGYFSDPISYSFPAHAPQILLLGSGERPVMERRRSGIPGLRLLPVVGRFFGTDQQVAVRRSYWLFVEVNKSAISLAPEV
jgi:hypothetical protein